MALESCGPPCFVTCFNGGCSKTAGCNENCFYYPPHSKWYDVTKLECNECKEYVNDSDQGKATCMSKCANPAGFSEEQLDELRQQTQKRNKLIIVIAVLLIVLIIVGTLIYSI